MKKQSVLCLRSLIRKPIAMLLVLSCILEDITLAAPNFVLSNSDPEFKAPFSTDSIQIPQHLGTLQKSWFAHKNPAAPLIIHLQDAHGNLDAQKNIERLMDFFRESYGIETFFLEGAAGKLDPAPVDVFEEAEKNQKVAQLLTERGILSGAELALTQTRSFQGWGVEDSELFKKNFSEYQSVIRASHKALEEIKKAQAQIVRESSRSFSPKLYKFYKSIRSTENSVDQMTFLMKHAQSVLHLDFTRASLQLDWPQLVRLAKLKEVEKDLDFEKASTEQKQLAKWFAQTHLKASDLSLINQFVSKKRLYRDWSTSPRTFLEQFYETAAPQGFSFKKYPALSRFFAAAILESEIEVELLEEESARLRNMIFDALIKNPEEKKLIKQDHQLELLKKLFKLELTRKEYEQIKEKGLQGLKSVKEGFKGVKGDKKGSPVSTRFNPPEPLLTPVNSLPPLNPFYPLYEKALGFYETALQRDQVMFRRLIDQMKSLKVDKAVLITGGFHAQGLEEAFRSHGISHLTILPHISEVSSSKAYQNIMLYDRNFSNRSTIPLGRVMDVQSDYGAAYKNFVRSELRLARQSVSPRSEVRAIPDHMNTLNSDQTTRDAKILAIQNLATPSNKANDDVRDALAEALFHQDPNVSFEAAVGLSKLDPSPILLVQVENLLTNIKEQTQKTEVIASFNGQDNLRKRFYGAVQILTQWKSVEYLDSILEIFGSSPIFRAGSGARYIEIFLAKMGAKSIPSMIPYLDYPDMTVRKIVSKTLYELSGLQINFLFRMARNSPGIDRGPGAVVSADHTPDQIRSVQGMIADNEIILAKILVYHQRRTELIQMGRKAQPTLEVLKEDKLLPEEINQWIDSVLTDILSRSEMRAQSLRMEGQSFYDLLSQKEHEWRKIKVARRENGSYIQGKNIDWVELAYELAQSNIENMTLLSEAEKQEIQRLRTLDRESFEGDALVRDVLERIKHKRVQDWMREIIESGTALGRPFTKEKALTERLAATMLFRDKRFEKAYASLKKPLQIKTDDQIKLIGEYYRNPALAPKGLLIKQVKGGGRQDLWEARVDSSIRIIYQVIGSTVFLMNVGTHDEVFGDLKIYDHAGSEHQWETENSAAEIIVLHELIRRWVLEEAPPVQEAFYKDEQIRNHRGTRKKFLQTIYDQLIDPKLNQEVREDLLQGYFFSDFLSPSAELPWASRIARWIIRLLTPYLKNFITKTLWKILYGVEDYFYTSNFPPVRFLRLFLFFVEGRFRQPEMMAQIQSREWMRQELASNFVRKMLLDDRPWIYHSAFKKLLHDYHLADVQDKEVVKMRLYGILKHAAFHEKLVQVMISELGAAHTENHSLNAVQIAELVIALVKDFPELRSVFLARILDVIEEDLLAGLPEEVKERFLESLRFGARPSSRMGDRFFFGKLMQSPSPTLVYSIISLVLVLFIDFYFWPSLFLKKILEQIDKKILSFFPEEVPSILDDLTGMVFSLWGFLGVVAVVGFLFYIFRNFLVDSYASFRLGRLEKLISTESPAQVTKEFAHFEWLLARIYQAKARKEVWGRNPLPVLIAVSSRIWSLQGASEPGFSAKDKKAVINTWRFLIQKEKESHEPAAVFLTAALQSTDLTPEFRLKLIRAARLLLFQLSQKSFDQPSVKALFEKIKSLSRGSRENDIQRHIFDESGDLAELYEQNLAIFQGLGGLEDFLRQDFVSIGSFNWDIRPLRQLRKQMDRETSYAFVMNAKNQSKDFSKHSLSQDPHAWYALWKASLTRIQDSIRNLHQDPEQIKNPKWSEAWNEDLKTVFAFEKLNNDFRTKWISFRTKSLARSEVRSVTRSEMRADSASRRAILEESKSMILEALRHFFTKEFSALENAMRPSELPSELPLAIASTRIEALHDIPAKAKLILESTIEEMDRSDKTLIDKTKSAVEKAMSRALEIEKNFTQQFPKLLKEEVSVVLRELMLEAAHIPVVSDEIKMLEVSPEIEQQYSVLPRLLKHYFTVLPELLRNPEITQNLQTISRHMQQQVNLFTEIEKDFSMMLDRLVKEVSDVLPVSSVIPAVISELDLSTAPKLQMRASIPARTSPAKSIPVRPAAQIAETKAPETDAPNELEQKRKELILSLEEASKAKNRLVMKILREELQAMKDTPIRVGREEKRSEIRSFSETDEAILPAEDPFPSFVELKAAREFVRNHHMVQGFKSRQYEIGTGGKVALAALLGTALGFCVYAMLANISGSFLISHFLITALIGAVAGVGIYGAAAWIKLREENYIFKLSYQALRKYHESDGNQFPEYAFKNITQIIPYLTDEAFEFMCGQWMARGQVWKVQRVAAVGYIGSKREIISRTLNRANLLEVRDRYQERFHDDPETLARINEDFAHWLEIEKKGMPNQIEAEVQILSAFLDRFTRYEEISFWMGSLWASRNLGHQINLPEFEIRYETFKGISQMLRHGAQNFALPAEQADEIMDTASSWISNLPAWGRDQKCFLAVQSALSQIISTAPNADWYRYGINVLFSSPVTTQQLPEVGEAIIHRVENVFVYGFLRASILQGLETTNQVYVASSFTQLEQLFGEPEKEGCQLHTITDGLTRVRRLPVAQKVHRMRTIATFHKYSRNHDTVRQMMRLYLDKEDAKDTLTTLCASNPEAAALIQRVDALLFTHFASVDGLKAMLGIYHHLVERLDKKEAVAGDVVRLMNLFDASAKLPETLETFFKSWEALLNFYFDRKGKGNFEELPTFLNGLQEKSFKITVLFASLLEVLTQDDIPREKRIARLKALKDEFDLTAMGYPASVSAVWDVVPLPSLFQSLGKNTIRARAHTTVVQKVLAKAGRNGLQTYWERENPEYYAQFRRETAGIPDEFFAPGEKFRFSYARASASKLDDEAVAPVVNPVQTMKDLVKDLRWRHANLYGNFIAPKREILQGRPLEDFIDEQSVQAVAKQFCSKLQDWEIPAQERMSWGLKVLGVLFHPELAPNLRPGVDESREEQVTRYWSDFLNMIKTRGYIRKGSKFLVELQDEVKKRLFSLVNDQTESREGVIQVMLTRGSLSDFFRGEISRDCTRPGEGHFDDTIGLPADPAFLAFKFVENGKWIGNIYSMLFQVEEDTATAKKGDYVVYVDQVAITPEASLAYKGQEYQQERQIFASRFFESISQFFALNGIKFMMLANDPTVITHMRTALKNQFEKWPQTSTRVMKPGGMGHKADLSVSGEYIQAIGTITPHMSVGGFLVELNIEDAKAADIKRRANEFKNMVKLRRQELESVVKTVIEIEDDMHKVSESISLYQERSRIHTVAVLQKAFNKMREESLTLHGRADVLNEEIANLETQMNGIASRSETRARSEMRSEEPIAYSIGMNHLKSQMSISRTHLDKVLGDLERLREALVAAEKTEGAVMPQLPKPEEVKPANSAEYSESWWKEFLAGRVTRLRLKKPVPAQKPMTIDEIRQEIERLMRQERLLKDTIAHHEQEIEVAKQWLDSTERDPEKSPFAAVLKMEETLWRIMNRVPAEVWEQLNRRFPDLKHRAFNLRPKDVIRQLMQSWERSSYFGKVLGVLDEHVSFNQWFWGQEAYQAFKAETETLGLIPEFDTPGTWVSFQIPSDPAEYSLVLAERDAEYLLRGFVSGDCTNCGPNYNLSSFLTATGTHIADPGMLNFKLMRDHEWIGNIYVLVLKVDGKPVMVVDALQIPWQGEGSDEGASPLYFPFSLEASQFPVKTSPHSLRIAAGSLLALNQYAALTNFQEIWLSSFVSNFHALQQFFSGALKPEVWDREVFERQKLGGWQMIELLGYDGRPYVESISHSQARLIWPHPDREARLARISALVRSELRAFPGIGAPINLEDHRRIDEAIQAGHKNQPIEINEYLSEILLAFSLDQSLDYPEAMQLFNNVKFQLVAVKPDVPENKHPSPGLGFDPLDPEKEIYTAVKIENAGQENTTATFYVGYGLYELASEMQKKAMILHSFYLAYRLLNQAQDQKYQIAIDLERLIDERIALLGQNPPVAADMELKFPGFEHGAVDRRNFQTRARAFSGLFTAQPEQTTETELEQILKTAIGLAKKFSDKTMFGYVGRKIEDMLDGDKMARLGAITEYVGEHKRPDLGEYFDEKIGEGKNILVLNTAAPTPLILADVRKILEHLSQGNRLRKLYLDLPVSLQPDLDEFFRTGKMTPGFSEKIAQRFPPFLPKEFSRPDLYIAILQGVYTHNQDTVPAERIQVITTYESPFPQGLPPINFPAGELPEIPLFDQEAPDFGAPGNFELPLPFGRGEENMPRIQAPQTSTRILEELLKEEAAAGTVTLLVHPMEEFLPKELTENPRVLSILHIDRYVGFGPEKEVNELAFYMSEGGGPKQAFVLPIYPQAPFYQEAIHFGVPQGEPFNQFSSYGQLIMSTTDEGGDVEKDVEPTVVDPDRDLVPVGIRSELRIHRQTAAQVSRDAAEKTVRPGLPNHETKLLVEWAAPEEFQILNLSRAMNLNLIEREKAFLQSFFSNQPAHYQQGRGRVIFSSDTFGARTEIFKALLQFFTLETSSDENEIPASYIFAGNLAGMLEAQIQNLGLEILSKHALRRSIRFERGKYSEIVQKENPDSVILSAKSEDLSSFVHQIFSALESQSEFFDPDLTIEQNASAYYVRARLLKQLAGELSGWIKQEISEREISRLVSGFFRENLGIALNPNQNGWLDLSLSQVHAQLEIFRQAYQRRQTQQAA